MEIGQKAVSVVKSSTFWRAAALVFLASAILDGIIWLYGKYVTPFHVGSNVLSVLWLFLAFLCYGVTDRRLLERGFQFGTWGVLAFLWVNFLWKPWPFTLNPLFDFLFSRTGGPLLFANHLSSVMMILLVTTWACFRDSRFPWRALCVVWATVPIHEFLLDFVMGPITGWAGLFNIANNSAPLGFFALNVRWVFWLSLFLVAGIYFAGKRNRRTLLFIVAVIFIYVFMWFVFLIVTGHSPWTLAQYAPGPMFLDPVDNFIEVMGWLIPMSIWLVRPYSLPK